VRILKRKTDKEIWAVLKIPVLNGIVAVIVITVVLRSLLGLINPWIAVPISVGMTLFFFGLSLKRRNVIATLITGGWAIVILIGAAQPVVPADATFILVLSIILALAICWWWNV